MRSRRWSVLVGAVGLVVAAAAPSAAAVSVEGEPACLTARTEAVTSAEPAPGLLPGRDHSAMLVLGRAAVLAHGRAASGAITTRTTPRAETGASRGDRHRARALRRAGWSVPEELPGGYTFAELRTLEDGAQPQGLLQVLYVRDEERVSVFQRRGSVEHRWLLADATPERGRQAWWWPEASPPRRAWEAEGTVYIAVGGASAEDLARATAGLPPPDAAPVERPLLRPLMRLVEGWLRLVR